MKNSINWFEIPVSNFDRAKAFYGAIFGVDVAEMPHPEFKYGMLPFDQAAGGVGGAIVQGPGFEPSKTGATLYLNGGDDLNTGLSKVKAAGGTILKEKTSLGPNGFMAEFLDTEGNKLAFHSMT